MNDRINPKFLQQLQFFVINSFKFEGFLDLQSHTLFFHSIFKHFFLIFEKEVKLMHKLFRRVLKC